MWPRCARAVGFVLGWGVLEMLSCAGDVAMRWGCCHVLRMLPCVADVGDVGDVCAHLVCGVHRCRDVPLCVPQRDMDLLWLIQQFCYRYSWFLVGGQSCWGISAVILCIARQLFCT